MSIHQYNTEWWRIRSLPQLLRRATRFLQGVPPRVIIFLSPVVPFFLLINEQITLLVALLLTQVPILVHHLVTLQESDEFRTSEPTDQPDNPRVEEHRTAIQREWEAGVRERLRADSHNAEAYEEILHAMNGIPNVIGFTTGMCEQIALGKIVESVRAAGLTAECALGHVLYAYAMGWTAAPVPGTGHGAFTRLQAIRVLRQFPEWPAGWEAQLSRVTHSLRKPPSVSPEFEEYRPVFNWVVFLTGIIALYIRFYIEELFGDRES